MDLHNAETDISVPIHRCKQSSIVRPVFLDSHYPLPVVSELSGWESPLGAFGYPWGSQF